MLYISFLHQTTTTRTIKIYNSGLLYISFLHQTTTCHSVGTIAILLLYISFLHQTTTGWRHTKIPHNCFISLFYIKPQLVVQDCVPDSIALYLFSTSNHNRLLGCTSTRSIALYLFSTSNHNTRCRVTVCVAIALYLFSTSNHNRCCCIWRLSTLLYISFLHQTTTSLFG